MVRLRRVSLERRHGNMEEAERLLQVAIKNAKSNNESSFYAIKLARHLFKIQKNLPKSRKVLLEAIERDKVCICVFIEYLPLKKKKNGSFLVVFHFGNYDERFGLYVIYFITK